MITSIKNKLYRWKYLIILSFLFVIILSVHTIVSFDIGFHLKAGEYIVKSRQVPQHDPFSHTVSDHPYIDSHWLFQLFLFTVYSLLGTGGIIVCKTIIFVVTFVILFRIGYKSGNYILSVLFISLCAFIVSERSIARPEIMTFLFLASYLFILHNYKYKKSKLLYLIPILQILWVNMHGLFVLGIALMIIYCAGELILRRFRLPLEWNDEYALKGKSYFLLLAVTFLSIIACFLTPYGHKGLFYALNLFTEIGEQASLHMKNIDELVPPFSKYMPNLYRIVSFYKILICVSIITFLLNFKRLKLTYFLIYCAFFYLSLLANRNIALFAIVSMPIMVINTDSAFPQIWPFSGRRARYAAKIAEGILAIFMVVVIFNLISNGYYATNRIAKRFGTGVSGLTNPKGAIRFIKEADIKGNVFNSVNFGGYFIWKCYPERKVFVDGRWELYGDDFLNDYYFSLINDRAFESLTGYYDINYALVDSQIALCERLYRDKNWKLIYFDEIAAIFIKDIPLNNGII